MHHPLITVALASAKQEDLMREARRVLRHRHREAASGQRPERVAARSPRLFATIPRGISAALAASRS